MITKTQYNYICTSKTGLTKTLQLMVGSSIVLWDKDRVQSFITIEDAEMNMCATYYEVMLESKAVTTITKIEKPVEYLMHVGGSNRPWCTCEGIYSKEEDVICPKCNRPIP